MAKKTSFDSIELSSFVQERVKEALQSKNVLNNLVPTINESVIRAVRKELKDLLDFKMDELKKLREDIKKRDTDHNQLKHELVPSKDELEQYQRRFNLRFFVSVPEFAWSESGKTFIKTTLSTLDQDSNLYRPVIGSLIYYKSNVLDHAAIEAVAQLNCPHKTEFDSISDALHHREILEVQGNEPVRILLSHHQLFLACGLAALELVQSNLAPRLCHRQRFNKSGAALFLYAEQPYDAEISNIKSH
uniref:Uncharacterized protein n=1 Tax=Timema genevievae TaxID=629358 RepID=A0A7R9PP68_TIMGE|nr:unnamed protein product [Timema genevievae]